MRSGPHSRRLSLQHRRLLPRDETTSHDNGGLDECETTLVNSSDSCYVGSDDEDWCSTDATTNGYEDTCIGGGTAIDTCTMGTAGTSGSIDICVDGDQTNDECKPDVGDEDICPGGLNDYDLCGSGSPDICDEKDTD